VKTSEKRAKGKGDSIDDVFMEGEVQQEKEGLGRTGPCWGRLGAGRGLFGGKARILNVKTGGLEHYCYRERTDFSNCRARVKKI